MALVSRYRKLNVAAARALPRGLSATRHRLHCPRPLRLAKAGASGPCPIQQVAFPLPPPKGTQSFLQPRETQRFAVKAAGREKQPVYMSSSLALAPAPSPRHLLVKPPVPRSSHTQCYPNRSGGAVEGLRTSPPLPAACPGDPGRNSEHTVRPGKTERRDPQSSSSSVPWRLPRAVWVAFRLLMEGGAERRQICKALRAEHPGARGCGLPGAVTTLLSALGLHQEAPAPNGIT